MKIITKQVHQVDAFDLEEAIQEEYGQPFEILADLEASNDTAKKISFTKSPLSIGKAKDVAVFRVSGRGNWLTYTLMQDMVNRELLPEGEYVIEISW